MFAPRRRTSRTFLNFQVRSESSPKFSPGASKDHGCGDGRLPSGVSDRVHPVGTLQRPLERLPGAAIIAGAERRGADESGNR